MKQYERYKESGVEWLGRVPEHWEGIANKYIFIPQKRIVGKKASKYVLLSLTLNGVIKRDMDNPQGKFPAEFDSYQKVCVGDFIFCHFDIEETPRTIGLSSFDGMITGAYTVYEVKKGFDKKFLYYYYLNIDNDKRMRSLYKGLRNTVSKEAFGSLKTFIPFLEEQKNIAHFLDQKCAQIDKAISQKERVIELLNERRQIIIQRAVTRGLDPNVPMKDSRVDWIGEIPEHWEVRKLKNVCDINPLYKNYQVKDNGEYVTFLPMEKVTEYGQYDNSSMERYKKVCNGFTYFEINDVIMAKITPCFENGKGAFLDSLLTKIGFGSTEFHVLRKHSDIDGRFLYYIIKSYGFRQMGEAMMTGSAGQKRVPTHFLTSYKSAIPTDIFEQQQIAAYLDHVNAKIDKAIAIKRQEIEKLKEYKTVLIDAAVTGKIKIA